jgi:PTS system mannose-specific IIA component
MVGVLVITHGKLAHELVNAAEMIIGEIQKVEAFSLGWNDDVEMAKQKIQEVLKKLNSDNGVIILTDIFGGTPTNLGLSFLKPNKIEIVTGVNLPMLLKLISQQKEQLPLKDIATKVKERGQQSIYIASEILSSYKKQ